MQQTYAVPVTVISNELVRCLRTEATTRAGAVGGHVQGLPSQVWSSWGGTGTGVRKGHSLTFTSSDVETAVQLHRSPCVLSTRVPSNTGMSS